MIVSIQAAGMRQLIARLAVMIGMALLNAVAGHQRVIVVNSVICMLFPTVAFADDGAALFTVNGKVTLVLTVGGRAHFQRDVTEIAITVREFNSDLAGKVRGVVIEGQVVDLVVRVVTDAGVVTRKGRILRNAPQREAGQMVAAV